MKHTKKKKTLEKKSISQLWNNSMRPKTHFTGASKGQGVGDRKKYLKR